jgi:ribosomal protein L32
LKEQIKMVQIQTEIAKKVAAQEVTKMISQPTNLGIDLLEQELTVIAGGIRSPQGNSGHAGILMEDADFMATFAVAVPFTAPANPGVYPVGPFPNGTRKEHEAEHEKLVEVYKTYLGVADGLKQLILKAVDEDYLLELKHEIVGYLLVTPKQMIAHLHTRWGSADFVDKCSLLNILNTPWNVAEVPTAHFNKVEKAIKQLARVNVPWPLEASMNSTLKAFKDSGDYDTAMRKWEASPEVEKTWANLKIMISNEYSKYHRQHAATAKSVGYGSANEAIDEYVAITEELVATISEENEQKLKALTKDTTDILKEIKALLENKAPAQAPTAAGTQSARAKKRTEYRKKLAAATACVNCGSKHPNVPDNKCWELEANAASRPTGWTSSKSN